MEHPKLVIRSSQLTAPYTSYITHLLSITPLKPSDNWSKWGRYTEMRYLVETCGSLC